MSPAPLLDTCIFQRLNALPAVDLKTELTKSRLENYQVQTGPLRYLFATTGVSEPILTTLEELVREQAVTSEWNRLLRGDIMNVTEHRSVTHHRFRTPAGRADWVQRIEALCNAVHNGQIRSINGNPIRHVVQIGIGGSELGPRAAYYALTRWADRHPFRRLSAEFIANLDCDDAYDVLSRIDIRETLFIVVSKSGDTLETRSNLAIIRRLAEEVGIPASQFRNQLVSVTTPNSLLDRPNEFGHIFHIDDGIGGRFSTTSPAGMVIIGLCFGISTVNDLLDGAVMMDNAAGNPDLRSNISLLSAAIGVWDRVCQGYTSRAVIPYCEGLKFLPAHLQQLECESNGKSVSVDGVPIQYPTSPVVFGHTGTQAQHSFFQNFHQGTDRVPIEFITVLRHQSGGPEVDAQLHDKPVIASVVGQVMALALGHTNDDPRKTFEGNRPSAILVVEELTPYTFGALLAYFENRTIFQGFLWHINSFDQEGVQLGKALCKEVLNGDDGLARQLFELICQQEERVELPPV
ncbi:glucose-6-phosphate isomerase [bacterium]|nr:glucose-6-phosphate isomerase [bacterium]